MAAQDRSPDDPTEPVAATAPVVPPDEVVAAGAIVHRPRQGDRGRRVLLVHRPKYDDWSWPKGKQDPGEHITVTAVREVLEETGVEIRLGRPLPRQVYATGSGKVKTVHYWVGHVVGDEDLSLYRSNPEIDKVRWTSPSRARQRLTYADDVELLETYQARPRRTRALIVLRHARARKRARWDAEDALRPLTRTGLLQARALAPVLWAYGVTRVVTSDSIRCVQTVAPYAREHVLAVEAVPAINERDATEESVAATVRSLLEGPENAVLCSHRPVLPALLAALGVSEEPLAAGEMIVCHHRDGQVVATERYLVR